VPVIRLSLCSLKHTLWMIVPPGCPVDWYSLWTGSSPSLHGLLSPLHWYYKIIRPLHMHWYFPPSWFTLIGFSLNIIWRVPVFHRRAWIKLVPTLHRMPYSP
jgi:hypothetical protein